MSQFSLESSGNNLLAIAGDIAKYLSYRKTYITMVVEGSKGKYVFANRKTGVVTNLELTWKPVDSSSKMKKFSPTYLPSSCYDLPKRKYGTYKLTAHGHNFCYYESSEKPYRFYPIIRQFSFYYRYRPFRTIPVDFFHLKGLLERRKETNGIILDLRENSGGNNPHWFIEWFAPSPYMGTFVRMLLDEQLTDPKKMREARLIEKRIDHYLEALSNRKPGQRFAPLRPFFYKPDTDSWDNYYVPKHRISSLPVVLLTSSGCMSSCDMFTNLMNENDFAKLVGEPTAATYTSHRLRYNVITPKSKQYLGFIRFAISEDISGKTKCSLEAVPLEIDYPVRKTFENRGIYDSLLIDAALKAFQEFSEKSKVEIK